MRVVTTANKAGLEQYGQRWLDSRKNWPATAEFWWYTEGYELPPQADDAIVRKDFAVLDEFMAWKAKHQGYVPPNWEFNVVGYSHKVFAAIDALYDYDGIGVWLDADCVTYQQGAGRVDREAGGEARIWPATSATAITPRRGSGSWTARIRSIGRFSMRGRRGI